MEEQPSLGQLIWLVRRELEWARAVDAGAPLLFDVDSVELDVDVEVSRASKGELGLDLKIVKAGGARELTKGTTSKVHVVLTPRDLRTSDGRYSVSAADTEPPPRRAETPVPAQETGVDIEPTPQGAVDTQPPPRR